MNFVTQLGLLAIILIILVILIKSNQTLEQIYMEGEGEGEIISIPPIKMPKIRFSQGKSKDFVNSERKAEQSRKEDYKREEKRESPDKRNTRVDRAPHTIPVESVSGWYVEILDHTGRPYNRRLIGETPFSIGRAMDNDYILDDLSVSGHHACIEKEEGNLELTDMGSLNKIIVGGRPLTKVEIIDRMEVALGNTKLRFCKENTGFSSTSSYKRDSHIEEWY